MSNLKFSPEQQEVWSREEDYWRVFKGLDREGYIALWEEKFVGWPCTLPAPVRKDAIRANPFGLMLGRELKSVHLQPKALEVFNDVAIAHYVVTGTYARNDGATEVESLRITHTWRKTNGVWLIIGGMSSPAQPEDAAGGSPS